MTRLVAFPNQDILLSADRQWVVQVPRSLHDEVDVPLQDCLAKDMVHLFLDVVEAVEHSLTMVGLAFDEPLQ